MLKSGKAYLIGAGPGDPKLLTLRAVEALRDADIVLVDDLVHPDVVAHARAAKIRHVGKRARRRSCPQELATDMLVEFAQCGEIVARVKGGDPFMFGRGGEEALALAQAKIPFEIVPGVSAPFGAAAYAGIPLTYRGIASSVAFVTGHREDGEQVQIEAEADTLVVFMCQRTIPRIARNLIAAGRSAVTCIAIIRGATWQAQEVYTGYLGEVARLADNWFAPLDAALPTMAIIGEVVSFADQLAWHGRMPTPISSLQGYPPLRLVAGGLR